MTAAEAIVLGIVQGLSEFLPISSKTHLIVVPALLGWDQPELPFLVLLHLGTLVALVAYFARDLLVMAREAATGGEGRTTVLLVGLATLPAAIAGLLFESVIADLVTRPRAAAAALVVTAVILVGAEWASGSIGSRRLPRPVTERPSAGTALLIGIAQAVALLPGVSRSGSTMSAGIALGLSREAAARFSFLMAIAAIAGANVLEFGEISKLELTGSAGAGFLAAAVSGYLAVWGLLRFLQRYTFLAFAAYCVVFALAASVVLA